MPPTRVALRRASVTSASARIGFDFCGMVEEPPPSASRTSPTSFCASSSTSWPSLPSEPVTNASQDASSPKPSRWLCQGIAGQPRPSSVGQRLHDLDPAVPDGDQVAGGTAELDHEQARLQLGQPLAMAQQRREPAGDLEPERGRHRLLEARPADDRRGAMLVREPGQGRDRRIEPPRQQRQRLAQLQDQGGVEDVLRGRTPMDESCRLAADLLAAAAPPGPAPARRRRRCRGSGQSGRVRTR